MYVERNKILEKLYTSRELKEALNKMHPEELRDDLRQEIFVALCEMPDDKLIALEKSGHLRFYAVRIMLNMIQSKTSRFYYKYRKPSHEPYNDSFDTQDEPEQCEHEFEQKITKITEELEAMHWYKKDLFDLYLKNGCNASAVSRQTKIPIRSIYHTIKEVKEHIKTKI